jgi:RHS repeat-associated protein
VTRYVGGVEGDIAVTTSLTGQRELQLVDLHGDIVATLPISDGADQATWSELAFTSFDEFGVAQPMSGSGASQAPPARYGWLGASQRSAEALGGEVLMGARLYSPAVGRFLQIDPVAGGSASAYDYCNADPVNCTDLDGELTWKGLVKGLAVVGELASMVPGPVGAVAGVVAAGAYLATGDKQKALAAVGGAIVGALGGGAVVAVIRGAVKAKAWASRAQKVYRAISWKNKPAAVRVRGAAGALHVTRNRANAIAVSRTWDRGSFNTPARTFAYHYGTRGRGWGGPANYQRSAAQRLAQVHGQASRQVRGSAGGKLNQSRTKWHTWGWR